jgi:hypothetical protein
LNSYVLYLRNAIAGGQVTGSQLETLMADAKYKGAWAVAVQMRGVMRYLANTPAAWPIIKASTTACRIMAMSAIAMTEITANNAAATALGVQRQIFTASGTWTKPTTLLGLAVVCIGGGGGSGASTGGNASTSGGGGGAWEAGVIDASTVTTNVTVTVGPGGIGGTTGGASPSAGGTSSFGAFLSAVGGNPGVNNNSGSLAAATTGAAGGRFWPLLPLYALPWQPNLAKWATPCSVPGQGGTAQNANTPLYSADGLEIGRAGATQTGYCVGGQSATGNTPTANTGQGANGVTGSSTAMGRDGAAGAVYVYWMS